MRNLRVCIDPGHGGSNRGTRVGDREEADYVLEVAQQLRDAMAGWQINVRLTRDTDVATNFFQRHMVAHDLDADLVIVLHVNAYVHTDPQTDVEIPDPKAHGMICFVLDDDGPAASVASAILRAAPVGVLSPRLRPWSALPTDWTSHAYACLEHYGDRCAVLVELGFRTNPQDLETLTGEAHRLALIVSLLAGVARAAEMIDSA